jgi:hypothetical protein
MNDNAEWDNLGNAIIEQAHEDYLEALLIEHNAVLMLKRAAKMKQSVLSFYGGDWYYSLTTVDPATLIDTARKQADYIIWQRGHKCGTCEIENCPHRQERTNWKLFHDGRRTCMKERDDKSETRKKQIGRLMDGLGLTEEQAVTAIHLVRGDQFGPKA